MSLLFESDDLPDHFEDDEILAVLPPSAHRRRPRPDDESGLASGEEETGPCPTRSSTSQSGDAEPPRYIVYPRKPSLGLLVKIRVAINRVMKRQKYSTVTPFPELLSSAWNGMCTETVQSLGWDSESLASVAEVLATKVLNLNGALIRELNLHPLLPPVTRTSSGQASLSFDFGFITRVRDYHASIERPEGTFSDARSVAAAEAALAFPRERCAGCGKRRQVYCGECGGLRMPQASVILPSRVEPPFDILLVVHWHESLHKCTGIHSAVLCTEGTVSHVHWEKEAADGSHFPWLPMVESLDATRDVLLFPSPDATYAEEFDWASAPTSNDRARGESSSRARYRLVVLEATWNHAKWISKQIAVYRQARGLAPLRCVALKDVVGQYWRFHEEGHSALSTIEAIAYTASAAGMPDSDMDSLLTLFRVQKGRVLLSVDKGEKVPRAMCVGGIGEGSWENVHIANPP